MVPNPVGDDFRKKENLHSRPQHVFPMEVFLCQDCGLIQLLDVVSPELLYGDYLYETSISLGLPDHFRAYAETTVAKLKPARGSRVIDIGCNDGTLLRAFRDLGFNVLGVDPATSIARKVKAAFGIDVIASTLSHGLAKEIRAVYGPASVVTANNVIANIDHLGEVAQAMHELLSPDGVFVLETGYGLDLVRSCVFDNIYHEHISYFSIKPMKVFCEKNGLELFDVDHVPTKGGSIRCYIQKKGGPRAVTGAIAKMIKDEENFGLYDLKTFQAMRKKMDDTKSELIGLLSDLKSKGKRIAGYGASVGAITVVYEFGLAEHLHCLLDENPIKFDTFSPGHHLPVLKADRAIDEKIDYVVVIAWRYVDPIVSKNQEFIRSGGKFISFFPEVAVLQ